MAEHAAHLQRELDETTDVMLAAERERDAVRQQLQRVLRLIRTAPRFYPSISTDGYPRMREAEEEIGGDWISADTLLAATARILGGK